MAEFRREIKKTQAKFIIDSDTLVVSENNVGQQSSYNLPQEFIDYSLNNGVLVEDATIEYSRKATDGNAYRLADGYKLVFAPGLHWMLGNKFKDVDNFFLASKNKAKDGTSKFQLFRTVYEKLSKSHEANHASFDWFVELYDRNLVGNSLLLEVIPEEKVLKLDVEMNAIKSSVDSSVISGGNMNSQNKDDNFEAYQLIYYGVPGTGKSYGITKKIAEVYPGYVSDTLECPYVFRTTLHPEYSYYDFVGSIIPIVTVDHGTNERIISYDFKAGIFTKALCAAFLPENQDKKIYLVLEEMSRANVAAVFGDIFQLLDRDDDGKSEYKIKNDVISSEIKKVCGIDLDNIYIPQNLYIYGSVNTSDQNVFVMDNAFKRRFEFEYVGTKPISDATGNLLNEYTFYLDSMKYKIKWNDFYQKFNSYVTKQLKMREDKQIGQFFIKFKKFDDVNKADAYNYRQICNKLLQYMWNDVQMSMMAKAALFEGVENYEDAYSKLSKHKNIFCQDFIVQFENQEIVIETTEVVNSEGTDQNN